jgi:hypothetical protein
MEPHVLPCRPVETRRANNLPIGRPETNGLASEGSTVPRPRQPSRPSRTRAVPRRKGVTVEQRNHGFVPRYTTPDGKRPSLPSRPTWLEAYEAACAEMDRIERARFRDARASQMTFAELVHDHYLPTYVHAAGNTRKNIDSHLGDGTGGAKRQGAKNQRAARFQIMHVFGPLWLREISPQDVRVWQAGLIGEGFAHSTIVAKRSVLRGILEVARSRGGPSLQRSGYAPAHSCPGRRRRCLPT